MVPWWKRLFYSFLSVVVSCLVCNALLALGEATVNSNAQSNSGEFLPGLALVLLCSLPGWVLAIPVVLIVTNIRGWRFWMYWAFGSAIGPLLMLGVAFYESLTDPSRGEFVQQVNPLIGLAAAISCATTLIYMQLLRRAQRAAAEKPAPSPE